MATLSADMKEFIENNLAWIATVSKDGELDLGPKMSMFVLDDNHLAYHERTAGQHYKNLQDGSQLVVAVANLAERRAIASAEPLPFTLMTRFTKSRCV